jgi:hypothetical protein
MGLLGSPDAQRHCTGTTERSAMDNVGVIDHVAFVASEPESFARRFDAIGLEARKRYLPDIELLQMFIMDPDGLSIELNFPGIAAEPSWDTGSTNDTRMAPAPRKNGRRDRAPTARPLRSRRLPRPAASDPDHPRVRRFGV